MIQAARSGKQNIVEGIGQSQTSKKGEIKLLGVAKASFEELQSDYEDFLRQQNLPTYPLNHPKIAAFRQIAYRLSNIRNLSDSGNLIEKPTLPGNPTDDANYLLHKQIVSAEEQFIKNGGYTKNLFQRRLKSLKNLK